MARLTGDCAETFNTYARGLMLRALLVLLLLLAVAGIAVLVLDGAERDADPLVDRESDPASQPPAVLRGTAQNAAGPSSPAENGGESATGERAEPEHRVQLPVTIRVAERQDRVSFEPSAKLEYAPLRFRTDSIFDPGLSHEIPHTGRFVLDVTEPATGLFGYRQVTVYFGHAAYMDVEVLLPARDLPSSLTSDVLLDEIEIVVRPARTLRGRYLDTEGAGVQGTALLYPMVGARPQRAPVAQASIGKDGHFRLKYGAVGRYLVTVDDFPVRLRPSSALVDLAMDKTPEPVVLRARPGESIAGRVLVEGEPNEEATVRWGTTGHPLSTKTRRNSWVEQEMSYADGEVHRGWGDVETDEHGDFEIQGLSPRSYELIVSELHAGHIHREQRGPVSEVVRAPERNVVFDVRLARIEVRATLDGNPIADVEFRFTAKGMDPQHPEGLAWDSFDENTDEDGKILYLVSPEHRYDVALHDDRFRYSNRDIKAPAAGKTRVLEFALRRAPPKPRLVVTLAGEGAEEVTVAGFGFYPPEVDPRSQTPTPVRAEESVDGRFVLKDLRAGRFRLHVRPGRAWGDKPNEWQEVTVPVDIPRDGEAAIRVDVHKGGRLLLTVIDANGRHLEAECTIQDARGTEVPAWFEYHEGIAKVAAAYGLPGAGPCWVEPVLAPGTYTVALKAEGYVEETRTVKLKAGEAAALRVEMKARR